MHFHRSAQRDGQVAFIIHFPLRQLGQCQLARFIGVAFGLIVLLVLQGAAAYPGKCFEKFRRDAVLRPIILDVLFAPREIVQRYRLAHIADDLRRSNQQ